MSIRDGIEEEHYHHQYGAYGYLKRRGNMSPQLTGSIVVISGASSGIGRATALEFARRGANVVVAARREQALRELVTECEQLGVQALAVPTDVTNEEALNRLAHEAKERFGRIDVWVNSAGVTAFGRLEEIPMNAYRQVIETNLFGEIYGARAVLPYFREQRSGVLINMASMDGEIGAPYLSAYVASKFAVRGFSESLRQEVEVLDASSRIRVCAILPATIDTPLFQHAANYSGRTPKALPPVYDVELAAKLIVDCAEKPRREVFVGSAARMMSIMHRLAPQLAERMYAHQVNQGHFKDEPAQPRAGNLFAPLPEGTGTRGGWGGREKTQTRRVVGTALAAVSSALLFGMWYWQHQRNGRS
jgi:short-subunit dehydrogenase